MMHKTCSINYGHLADLQKTLPTTDLNKKNFHLIKYLLATFIFFLSFQSVLVYDVSYNTTLINVDPIPRPHGLTMGCCVITTPHCMLFNVAWRSCTHTDLAKPGELCHTSAALHQSMQPDSGRIRPSYGISTGCTVNAILGTFVIMQSGTVMISG